MGRIEYELTDKFFAYANTDSLQTKFINITILNNIFDKNVTKWLTSFHHASEGCKLENFLF